MTTQRHHARPSRTRTGLAALAMCLALNLACKGESGGKEGDGGSHSDSDKSAGGGSPLSMMGPFAKMFASGLSEPGPYDAPRKSADYAEGAPHWLVVELDKPIAELESLSLFGGTTSQPLRELQAKLRKAANNEHVEGIALRANGLAINLALATELRASLKEFRAAGKRLECHTENVANAGYYVFTACDSIVLSPLGSVAITGAAATPIHIKGLLDRVGVTADFLHVGDYKGAAEPITRTEPSPEMMETLGALLDQSYATQVAAMVDGRGMDDAAAKAAIDQALFVGDAAVEAKLVDSIATWEDFVAAKGKPWTSEGSKNPLDDMTTLQRFIGLMPPEVPTEPHVALVYAVGNVIDGKGNGVVGAREEIASRTLVATLRALADNDSVKAVVLRVSSPGGSALASELIWHAVEEVKKSKPVVVSMGGVAASGGYYISAGATKIFAEPDTITGSIGVVGGKFVLGDALASVGVTNFELKRGERALIWSSMKPWTESERAAVQSMMEATYDTFVSRVSAGRGLSTEAVHKVAQGRVWTGTAAKAHGLVDELGGLDAALAEAQALAKVEASAGIEVYPAEPTLRDLLSSYGAVHAGSTWGSRVDLAVAEVGVMAGPQVAAQVASLVDTTFSMRDTRIWAMTWVQPL